MSPEATKNCTLLLKSTNWICKHDTEPLKGTTWSTQSANLHQGPLIKQSSIYSLIHISIKMFFIPHPPTSERTDRENRTVTSVLEIIINELLSCRTCIWITEWEETARPTHWGRLFSSPQSWFYFIKAPVSVGRTVSALLCSLGAWVTT